MYISSVMGPEGIIVPPPDLAMHILFYSLMLRDLCKSGVFKFRGALRSPTLDPPLQHSRDILAIKSHKAG